jgi:hypothetical protein
MIIGEEWDWHVKGREISRALNILVVGFNIKSIRALAELVGSNETRIDLMNFADPLAGQPDATLLLGNRHFYTSDYQVHRRANWSSVIKMQSIRTQPDECINGENQTAEHNENVFRNALSENLFYTSINGFYISMYFSLLALSVLCLDCHHLSIFNGRINGEKNRTSIPC